jgi:hypothetical protein
MSLNIKIFKDRSILLHNDRYIYDKVIYKNLKTKVDIICKDHGLYQQLPIVHLRGSGCSKCSKVYKYSTLSFIEKAQIIHQNKYTYKKTKYVNNSKHLIITCPHHGDFKQNAKGHLNNKNGCPICKIPKGELKIRKLLLENNIEFTHHQKFKDCAYKNKLSFDFYLPNLNMCIEYDGIQHFEPVEYFGGDKVFKLQIKKDLIKTQYCEKNNIKLVRIKYNDNILKVLIGEHII